MRMGHRAQLWEKLGPGQARVRHAKTPSRSHRAIACLVSLGRSVNTGARSSSGIQPRASPSSSSVQRPRAELPARQIEEGSSFEQLLAGETSFQPVRWGLAASGRMAIMAQPHMLERAYLGVRNRTLSWLLAGGVSSG